MPLFMHIGALWRVHGRGPPFVAKIGYHSSTWIASTFLQKLLFSEHFPHCQEISRHCRRQQP